MMPSPNRIIIKGIIDQHERLWRCLMIGDALSCERTRFKPVIIVVAVASTVDTKHAMWLACAHQQSDGEAISTRSSHRWLLEVASVQAWSELALNKKAPTVIRRAAYRPNDNAARENQSAHLPPATAAACHGGGNHHFRRRPS